MNDLPLPRPIQSYELFGGTLSSNVVLPGLPETVRPSFRPDWVFRQVAALPDDGYLEELGRDALQNGVGVRLLRSSNSLLLRFDDTGTFRITRQGTSIEWLPGSKSVLPAVAADVAGRVLATALHVQGVLTLHASAIALTDGVIALAGAPGTGKTTLAAAILARAGRFVADDALPVEVRPRVRARPGLPRLRLENDVEWLMADIAREGRSTPSSQRRLPGRMIQKEAIALAAVYLLEPGPASPGTAPVVRTILPGTRAAVALLAEARVGKLLGGAESLSLLGQATALARQVPVYRLKVCSDMNRLDDAARQILVWHQRAPHLLPS